MSIGNRVFLKRPMPSQELLEGFVGLPAANIADTMGRSCAMNPRIRLMSGFQGIMAGPALTVRGQPVSPSGPGYGPAGRRHRVVQ
jgi:regulator of RNase E activity RraA